MLGLPSVLLILVWLCPAFCANKGFLVLEPQEVVGGYTSGPLAISPDEFNVTAELIHISGEDFCNSERLDELQPQIQGKIVSVATFSGVGGCGGGEPSRPALLAARRGAVGIILDDGHGVGYGEMIEPEVKGDFRFPALTIGTNDINKFTKLMKDGETVIVNIQRPDKNLRKEIVQGPAGILIQIFFFIYLLATLGLAVFKLRQFISMYGIELSVTQVCLALDIIAVAIGLVFMIDPYGFHGIFLIEYSAIIVTYSLPFSITSVLLIAFYWNGLLSKVSEYREKSQWLQQRKKPFFVSAVIVFVVLFLLATLDLAIPGQGIESVLIVALIAIFSLVVACFFLFNGIRLLLVFKAGASNKAKRAKSITSFVAGLGVNLIMVIVGLIGVSVAGGNSTGVLLFAHFHLYFWFFTIPFLVVMAFQPPSSGMSSSEDVKKKSGEISTEKQESQSMA